MAKYRTLKNGVSIDCNILNESEGKYIVEFNNGVIRDVDKNRVFGLDTLDEGVLDAAKDIARKVKKRVSSFISGFIKKGKYIFFTDENNRILPAVSPLALSKRAESEDGILFFKLGDGLADFANSIGEEVNIVESDGSDSADYYDAINEAYNWKEAHTNPDYNDEDAHLLIELQSQGTGKDVNMTQILNILDGMVLHAHERPMDSNLSPICIWGAPGIGKTAIVKNLAARARQLWPRLSLYGIDARTMFKSDLANPSTVKREVYDREGNKFVIEKAIDIMKDWLPVFDEESCKIADDPEKTYKFLDDVANGGHIKLDTEGNIEWEIEPEYEIDKNGEIVKDKYGKPIIITPGKAKWVEGEGGIIFIDELSRIEGSVLNSFMSLLSDRTIGSASYKLGSKWIIIGAANRKFDMYAARDAKSFEIAIKSRLAHVNYVPTLEEWLEWAEDDNKYNEPNVLPIITNFLRTSAGKEYFYKVQKETQPDEFINYYLDTCSPRRWTQLSAYISMLLLRNSAPKEKTFWMYSSNKKNTTNLKNVFNLTKAAAEDSNNPDLNKKNKEVMDHVLNNPDNFIFDVSDPYKIPADTWANWVCLFCGYNAANEFKTYYESNIMFSKEDAEAVWKTGKCPKLVDNLNADTSEQILKTVLDNNPFINDPEPIPEDALNNVYTFIKTLSQLSGDTQGASSEYRKMTQMVENYFFKIKKVELRDSDYIKVYRNYCENVHKN